MCGFPVIAEAAFLDHGEEFFVAHLSSGGLCFRGHRRLGVVLADRTYFVRSGFAAGSKKIFVANAISTLRSDWRVLTAIDGAIDLEVTCCVLGRQLPT